MIQLEAAQGMTADLAQFKAFMQINILTLLSWTHVILNCLFIRLLCQTYCAKNNL